MLASRITHTHSGASRVGYISIFGGPGKGVNPKGGVSLRLTDAHHAPSFGQILDRPGSAAGRCAVHPIMTPTKRSCAVAAVAILSLEDIGYGTMIILNRARKTKIVE